MGERPLISRATSQDLPVLLVMIREFCVIDQHDFCEDRLRRCIPPLLDDDELGVIWKIGNPVDGYAVVTWGYSLESGGREALIDEIYLRSRGRGQGQVVLQQIVDDCRSRGCQKIFLETELHNVAVRRFYAKAGFIEDDSIWMSLNLCS